MSQIPPPVLPIETIGLTATASSGRFQMMNAFQNLFDAHTQKFITELERVKDETLAVVRRNLVEQSQSIAESLTQSHNLQMAAINAVLAGQAKQHEWLKLQQETVQELPNTDMWNAVVSSVHALEARLGHFVHDEDGEYEQDLANPASSTSITTVNTEPVIEDDDFTNDADPPSLASSPAAEVTITDTRRRSPSSFVPLQPIEPLMPLDPLESKPKISSRSRSPVSQLENVFRPEPYPSPVSHKYMTPASENQSTDFSTSSLDPLAQHTVIASCNSPNPTHHSRSLGPPSAPGVSGSSLTKQPSSSTNNPSGSDLHSPVVNLVSTSTRSSKPKKKRRSETVERKPQLAGTKRKRLSSSGSPRTQVQWPAPTELVFGRKPSLIKCDQCDTWYHTCCVGIEENEQLVVDEAVFICPRCETMGPTYVPRRTSRTAVSTCGRPDCKVVKAKVKEEEQDAEYVIEAIIGRRPTRFINNGVWDYLLKWEGYETGLSNWIPSEEVGGSETLVPRFEAAARAEGLDLRFLVVLLKSAREAPNPAYER